MITVDDLDTIAPHASEAGIAKYLAPLNGAMHEFHISDTGEREAAFIAQLLHESGGFRYVREIASGADYEGRVDLGNTESGDGVRFKGRGLIQITGRANYRACGEALGLDLLNSPELLETPENACRASAWWWSAHGLNELADKGDFKLITRRINGGYTGYAERLAYYERAKEVLA